MSEYANTDEERKKAIFDAMGPRNQKVILKKGYDKWDPFQEPKDPIDIRKDKTKRTSQMLIREFLSAIDHDDYSNSYAEGAFKMCLGIVNDEENIRGILETLNLDDEEEERRLRLAVAPEGANRALRRHVGGAIEARREIDAIQFDVEFNITVLLPDEFDFTHAK